MNNPQDKLKIIEIFMDAFPDPVGRGQHCSAKPLGWWQPTPTVPCVATFSLGTSSVASVTDTLNFYFNLILININVIWNNPNVATMQDSEAMQYISFGGQVLFPIVPALGHHLLTFRSSVLSGYFKITVRKAKEIIAPLIATMIVGLVEITFNC